MCFSVEASFTAAIILGGTGAVTLKNNLSRPLFFLAAIPFLFAIQQFSEGLVWLHLSHQVGSNVFFLYAKLAFLAFAFLIWPIWIPLSFAVVESISWRRYLLFFLFCCGVLLSLLNLWYADKANISVQVIYHSLQYSGNVPKQAIPYALIVLLPMFLSSLRNAWIFGILTVLAYFTADYFYTVTFVSVWCFFAAMISLSVYKIVRDNSSVLEKNAI